MLNVGSIPKILQHLPTQNRFKLCSSWLVDKKMQKSSPVWTDRMKASGVFFCFWHKSSNPTSSSCFEILLCKMSNIWRRELGMSLAVCAFSKPPASAQIFLNTFFAYIPAKDNSRIFSLTEKWVAWRGLSSCRLFPWKSWFEVTSCSFPSKKHWT